MLLYVSKVPIVVCLTSALPKILTEVETFGERCLVTHITYDQYHMPGTKIEIQGDPKHFKTHATSLGYVGAASGQFLSATCAAKSTMISKHDRNKVYSNCPKILERDSL